MNRKQRIHENVNSIAHEALQQIRDREGFHQDRWVPASEVKDELALNYVAVPRQNKQYGPKGWLFAIVARILEDENKVEYRKSGARAFYRSMVVS